jgi:peroxiredoxin
MSPRLLRTSVLAVCLLLAGGTHAFAQSAAKPARPPLKDPSLLLLRDAAIHAELGLKPAEMAALKKFLLDHNDLLILLRDVGPTGAPEELQPEIAELRDKLAKLLRSARQDRLTGLVLQAQGYDSLTRDDIAEKLGLSDEQRASLAEIMNDFWAESQQLSSDASRQSPKSLKVELDNLQAERHRRILEELTPQQEQRWGELLGSPFDFSRFAASPADAPEFVAVEEWINSPPLKLADLRGKVVVIHFFAFQCSNCHNNFPWYRQWVDELAGKDVAIIGIHTPETGAEADNNLLKAALVEHDLKFPVAVDKSKRNWEAWHNGIWPSVYLVDKQGRLRSWWYGELNWQGAGGQERMRKQIDQLLAETAPDR